MAIKTVGRFSIDTTTGIVSGPADYMAIAGVSDAATHTRVYSAIFGCCLDHRLIAEAEAAARAITYGEDYAVWAIVDPVYGPTYGVGNILRMAADQRERLASCLVARFDQYGNASEGATS